ncbi:MAG: branched-chain amino acid ABC transporter substrate-binding protein [Ardenticatenaceae bacterium]|nr:branched-chain amino acid ABC transporter substrate-binding protein [Ardenticatenaceae bacterium]MCB9446158.1 branched-chain amino acid ABC transporter substrate-binding protein [Ardenticatenaceae bacterium]
MKIGRWIGLFVSLLVSGLAVGCTGSKLVCQDALGCVEVRPNEPIRIGYLLAESGTAVTLGQDSKGGIELAIDNRENGVMGHQIELAGWDTACNINTGQTAAGDLVADPTIVGVIGTTCSDVAEAVMPTIAEAGLVMISPSNTAPRLTAVSHPWQDGYARTAHSNRLQGQIGAEFAYHVLGGRTAVILHEGSDYTLALAQAFADAWRAQGGSIMLETQIAVSQPDLEETLTGLAFNPPDVIYLALFEPEAIFVANGLVGKPALADISLLGSENLLLPDFPLAAGTAVVGMYVTGTAVTGADYDVFLAQWDVTFGQMPTGQFHAHAYDAANILLNAIESSSQQGSDGTTLIGRQALRQAIRATTDFPGLTGTLSCDAAGDCASGEALRVYQITAVEISGEQWPPPVVWQPTR